MQLPNFLDFTKIANSEFLEIKNIYDSYQIFNDILIQRIHFKHKIVSSFFFVGIGELTIFVIY